MMNRYFRAECLKCRHTAIGKLIFLMPLCSILLAALLTHNFFAVDGYNWWYIMLFPAMTALVCGNISGRDRKMKDRAFLVLPVKQEKIWDGKVLCGICGIGISLLVLFTAVLTGTELMKNLMHIQFTIEPTVKTQAAATLILWISGLWQVPFCLLLAQKTGMFPMLIAHVGIYGIAATFFSLKPYFVLFPGALAARMMCAVLHVLPNGLPAQEGMVTFTPELLAVSSVWIGIAASVLWFLFFWIVGRIWFRRKGRG